ncbi:nitrate reductase [Magnetospirillum sulfuroxidans]|uniref:Molybdopterin-dependent oxidoreductase n=1 Tax=Magnetospirillum sulfuroxidans TaxID=611300 RepID=A0ABS5IB89_9PROT|nr:nitrate reductase [Magnetospirillum sulfuroxidans]MBR9971018.1 molybdopterin-dependent oxidoreductase [Magnetospirillum sulfuroxidans]
MAEPIRTTCPYCGTGCGIIAEKSAAGWAVRGDPEHPANYGRLCSKGTTLADTLGLETRLLQPVVDGRPSDWDTAITETAGRIRAVTDLHGPDAFAFYLSGQLLTEDYYAANKLAKGFIGTANVDTNSRLCMASTVAGHRRAFGSDTVPGCYEDLERADLVVLVGSNLAWCHPVLFQRLKKARDLRGTKVVVIDPRRTDSCDIADLHLPLAPGSDVALFNGLLAHCEAAGALDFAFIDAHTTGFSETLAAARAGDVAVTGLDRGNLTRFFDLFATTRKVVTVFSQGVNQSSAGTDKVSAILNVHLATGRIGHTGMGPFSVTGQPNAMGGREVGGLANQLAAHMGFDPVSIDRVGRFWKAAKMATSEGLKAVELFRAIDAGKVKAVWIMATNPAVSLPESDLVRRALAKCPVVIVSDGVADTDTLRFAHIKLPAHAWGEKSGTVTNSDRTISRQAPFLSPAGEARANWWAVAQVARVLGHGQAFAWPGPQQVFDEYARLTGFENGGSRDLDLSEALSLDYDRFRPFQWGGKRMFGDGRFYTADGRAVLVPVSHRPPKENLSLRYPLRLNTGRYRDHWHTLTRTALAPRLSGHRPEALLDIHPDDAAKAGLTDGALAVIRSRLGQMIARARLTQEQQPGHVFLPMHWNDCFAAQGLVGRLLPGHTDPLSGQPESKHAAVRVTPFAATWAGALICAAPPPLTPPWWSRHRQGPAQVVEMAGTAPAQIAAQLDALDQHFGPHRLEIVDAARGIARYAWITDGKLVAALFIAPDRPDMARAWVAGLIGTSLEDGSERTAILAGKAPGGQADQGPIICACFSVGLHTIQRLIASGQVSSVAAIGAALKAGTGCGSCVGELKGLLARKETALA